jgi:hypothetical protein
MCSAPDDEGNEDRPTTIALLTVLVGQDTAHSRTGGNTGCNACDQRACVDDQPERIRALFVKPPNDYK